MTNRRGANAANIPQQQQRGQALTEFLVAALALIPLFLLVPMIGKYQDISNATQMASRYVAFEAMTRNDSLNQWKSETELANEVRRRFFSNTDAPIKTGDQAGDFKAHQNLFWRDPKDAPLIKSFADDIRVSFGDSSAATHQGGFKNASDNHPFQLHQLLSLQARGTYTAGVTVDLAKLPAGLRFYEPFDEIQLQMTRSTSVLIDHWSGRNPKDVQWHLDSPKVNSGRTLRPIVPGVKLAVTAAELPPWGKVPPPRLGQLDFWQDTVPKDRLHQ